MLNEHPSRTHRASRLSGCPPPGVFQSILCSEKFFHEALASFASSVIPAKAGIQNYLNPAFSGTGFRVALRLPGMTTSACFRDSCKGLFSWFMVSRRDMNNCGETVCKIKSREHWNLPTAFKKFYCVNPAGSGADSISLWVPPPQSWMFAAHRIFPYPF